MMVITYCVNHPQLVIRGVFRNQVGGGGAICDKNRGRGVPPLPLPRVRLFLEIFIFAIGPLKVDVIL